MTKRFRFHSNSRGADEIKDLPISVELHAFTEEILNGKLHFCAVLLTAYSAKIGAFKAYSANISTMIAFIYF